MQLQSKTVVKGIIDLGNESQVCQQCNLTIIHNPNVFSSREILFLSHCNGHRLEFWPETVEGSLHLPSATHPYYIYHNPLHLTLDVYELDSDYTDTWKAQIIYNLIKALQSHLLLLPSNAFLIIFHVPCLACFWFWTYSRLMIACSLPQPILYFGLSLLDYPWCFCLHLFDFCLFDHSQ